MQLLVDQTLYLLQIERTIEFFVLVLAIYSTHAVGH